MEGRPAIVRMTDGDVERVPPILARAFTADPLFAWIEPDQARRAAFLVGFMRALAWRRHLLAEAYTTADEALGERHGFAVLHAGHLPAGGPAFWTMVRRPRSGP